MMPTAVFRLCGQVAAVRSACSSNRTRGSGAPVRPSLQTSVPPEYRRGAVLKKLSRGFLVHVRFARPLNDLGRDGTRWNNETLANAMAGRLFHGIHFIRQALRRGSAWPMTRWMAGKRRRRPSSTASTRSCTARTDSVGSARQWKLTISPSGFSRTRTSWTSPRPARPSAVRSASR